MEDDVVVASVEPAVEAEVVEAEAEVVEAAVSLVEAEAVVLEARVEVLLSLEVAPVLAPVEPVLVDEEEGAEVLESSVVVEAPPTSEKQVVSVVLQLHMVKLLAMGHKFAS